MITAADKRRARVRAKISGSPMRPRLSVRITNRHVIAQIIDDTAGRTICYVTTVGAKASGNMSERAAWVGEEIAKQAKTKKVKQVVFDRGSRLYHGRLSRLAEAARKQGLEF